MRKSRLLPLAGLALFLLIISRLDFMKIMQSLSNVNLPILSLSLLAASTIITIKVLKWKVLIRAFGFDYQFSKAARSWLIGFFIGIITPGRIGDFYRAVYLRDHLKPGVALLTVVVDRLIDVLSLFVLGIVGASLLILMFTSQLSWLLALIALSFVLFIVLVIIMSKKEAVRFLVKPIFSRIVPSSQKSSLRLTFHDFYSGLSALKAKKASLAISIALSLLVIPLLILQYGLMMLSLGLYVPFWFLTFVIPVIMLIDALPISFSGLGTRDMALIFFFSMINLSAESAVSASIMILFFGYVIFGLLGFALWLLNPPFSKGWPREIK